MCVWKYHGANPPQELIDKMQNKARELFCEVITFSMIMRKIPDHFHFHITNWARSNRGILRETQTVFTSFQIHFQNIFIIISVRLISKKTSMLNNFGFVAKKNSTSIEFFNKLYYILYYGKHLKRYEVIKPD